MAGLRIRIGVAVSVAIAGTALFIASKDGVTPAYAKPPAAAEFCKLQPTAHMCTTSTVATCATCHDGPPALNLFGKQVQAELAKGKARPLADSDFLAALGPALKAVENKDADGDGYSNLDELLAGSRPDDATNMPAQASTCSDADKAKAKGGRWNTCGYDPAFAYRKVSLDFCGRSLTRAEMDAFDKLKGNDAAWKGAISAKLDQCLKSKYWLGKDGVLWNLANPKVNPVDSIKAGAKQGPIPLADYEFDYDLYAYINSGDRDVRDLLTGQYFVKRVSDEPSSFAMVDEGSFRALRQAGQTVAKDKRVGMLTTRWFTTVNTMFTPIPRTTAAAAYRNYLGFNISKMEGLHPVTGEPADYDNKGVAAPACAVCHTTLDPLTYPFTRYNGISRNNYDDKRLNDFVRTDGAKITSAPEKGIIFGQEVADLKEWGQVAANSDAFAQKVVWDYWKLLIGREPEVHDQRDFTLMWKGLRSADKYNYRVEKMLHGLVLTDAYGAP